MIFRFRVFASIPVTVFFFRWNHIRIFCAETKCMAAFTQVFSYVCFKAKVSQQHPNNNPSVSHEKCTSRFNNCFKNYPFFCLVSWGMTRFNNFDIPTFKGCVCFPKNAKTHTDHRHRIQLLQIDSPADLPPLRSPSARILWETERLSTATKTE